MVFLPARRSVIFTAFGGNPSSKLTSRILGGRHELEIITQKRTFVRLIPGNLSPTAGTVLAFLVADSLIESGQDISIYL